MPVRVNSVHFLLLEDDDLVASAYHRVLKRHGAISVASLASEAELFAKHPLTGLIADVNLPDGNGVDVARTFRNRNPDLPILFISGGVDGPLLDAAHEMSAAYLLKPLDTRQLGLFAERAIARQRRLERLVEAWAARHDLTAAESVTLRLALEGMRREDIASKRGVSVYTARNQIISLLHKVGAAALSDVVTGFYRELALGRTPHR